MAAWTDVVVLRDSFHFPALCVDCLRSQPETCIQLPSAESKLKEHYVVAAKYEHLVVTVPFCQECAQRQLRRSKFGQGLLVVGMLSGLVMMIQFDWGRLEVLLYTVAVGVPGLWLMHVRGWTVHIERYDEKTVTLSFKRPEYLQEFIRANQGAVVAGK